MVTAAQLQILQSPITSLISSVSSSVNVKLDDTNYLAWHFQMQLLLEGHSIIGFVDGSMPCPAQFSQDSSATSAVLSGDSSTRIPSDDYTIWKMHDKALMQLITATLSPAAVSCKIKEARDLLSAAGVFFYDDDIVILTLNGLPAEFNTIRSMIRGRESVISLKDLRSQLLAEEILLDNCSHSPVLSALMAQSNGLPSKNQSFSGNYGNNNHASPNSTAYKSFNNTKGRNRFTPNFNPKYDNYKNFHSSPAPGILGTSPPRSNNYGFLSQPCQICGKHNHLASTCRFRNTNSVQGCQICGKNNHFADTCRFRNSGAPSGCTLCGNQYHSADTCFQKKGYTYPSIYI
ncbi:uncharacterized protein [Malus domestica]|uniref:uncharacterized protein n=1 Tax=Malus domestica TaxID=3750 RepID=UPI00397671EA